MSSQLTKHDKNHSNLPQRLFPPHSSALKRSRVLFTFGQLRVSFCCRSRHVHLQQLVREKKKWREEKLLGWLPGCCLRHSSWQPKQLVRLKAKFCHDDDLKCAPSTSSSSSNGQWHFDSRAVIGFHLGTMSVFYSPVAHMYSLRT